MTQAVIEVSHLPSAASFYAAVTQPFGIRFLSSSPNGSSLYFGFPAFPPSPSEVILTLVACSNPVATTITFTASSRETVKEFHDRAVRAADFDTTSSLIHIATGSVAQVYDLDGNMVEARHSARRSSEPAPEAIPPKPTNRIEAWREDVDRAATETSSVIEAPKALSRVASLSMAEREEESTSKGLVPGLSNKALIGTVLGAAAGAIAAYAMVRSEEPEFETVTAVPISATPARTQYAESIPATRMYQDERARYYSPQQPAEERIVEIERSIKSMTGVAKSVASPKSTHYSVIRMDDNDCRTVVYRDEIKSQVSRKEKSRVGTEVSHRSKSRSNEPRAIMPAPSYVSSRHSKREPMGTVVSARNIALPESVAPSRISAKNIPLPESVAPSRISARNIPLPESVAPSRVSRSGRDRDPDRTAPSSYVSARTSRSKSTVRHRGPESTASKSHRSSAREKGSHVSARNVPLPETVIDDCGSVAPSDSVSSVGSKRERMDRVLGLSRLSLVERGSPREVGAIRGAMSETERLRRRF